MIAQKVYPKKYDRWNRQSSAPFGRLKWKTSYWKFISQWIRLQIPYRYRAAILGPFSIQPNSTTRRFEYPWCFYEAGIQPGDHVLEIGGGLAGFQFVLNRNGCSVVNVDPGLDASGVGWFCDHETMARLNKTFGTSVRLENTTIDKADLKSASFDTAFAISVLEHLTPRDLRDVMTHVYRALKPSGRFIITLDLFLDLKPFTQKSANKFGTNINASDLIGLAPFVVEKGNRDELLGFPGFSVERVSENLDNYLIGEGYPVLIQCLVLRKSSTP